MRFATRTFVACLFVVAGAEYARADAPPAPVAFAMMAGLVCVMVGVFLMPLIALTLLAFYPFEKKSPKRRKRPATSEKPHDHT